MPSSIARARAIAAWRAISARLLASAISRRRCSAARRASASRSRLESARPPRLSVSLSFLAARNSLDEFLSRRLSTRDSFAVDLLRFLSARAVLELSRPLATRAVWALVALARAAGRLSFVDLAWRLSLASAVPVNIKATKRRKLSAMRAGDEVRWVWVIDCSSQLKIFRG
jgi:hypothetical protein